MDSLHLPKVGKEKQVMSFIKQSGDCITCISGMYIFIKRFFFHISEVSIENISSAAPNFFDFKRRFETIS